MGNEGFKIDSDTTPLGYAVVRGETTFARCRDIEAAKLVLDWYKAQEQNKVKIPYE